MLIKEEIYELFSRFKIENPIPKTELIFRNEYTFVIAVLLSAQATDKAVNRVTTKLFEVADNPEKMLSLGIDRLKEFVKTVGLHNNKAKNIIFLSEKLIKKYNSKIPQNRDELEKLPGIGRKSANVIANNLFSCDTIAVDTHVLRLSNRIGLSKSKTPIDVEKDLVNAIPKEFHKNVSNWLVLHGRYVCTAKNPKCTECFLFDLCKFTIP
ncbi:MAG: endonuclease III [Holosporales bacterium]|jgi:endonuclease-3|nr:endonuclease III [Holosporales bacterium]